MKVLQLSVVWLAVLFVLSACGGGTSSGNGTISDGSSGTAVGSASPSLPNVSLLNEVLADIAHHVIVPTYASFETSAANLVTTLADYDVLIKSGSGSAEELKRVQQQWIETMVAWQAAEVLQLGPAAPVSTLEPAVGAMGLRDEIYSWPTVNQCRVDQELVEQKFLEDGFFDQELNNVYGLDASEYLIFAESTDNACPPQAAINADGLWEAFDAEEIAAARITYALALAENVLFRADELHSAWAESEGNFVSDFANAGQENSVYRSAYEALNDLSDALFYIEKVVKDYKLARPMGLIGCSEGACPDNVESRFSRMSKEAIIANLQAAHKIFTGAQGEITGLGLQDYLNSIEVGEAFAEPMIESLRVTLETLETMDSTIYDAVGDEPECLDESSAGALCKVYFSLKGFTDRLKSNFLEVLKLELPASASGDAD